MKTHFADDETLAYIKQLEAERGRYKEALEELQQEAYEEVNLHCTYVTEVCDKALGKPWNGGGDE